MTTAQIDDSTRPRPLRLWPGVAIVAIQWLAWLVLPLVMPEAAMIALLAGMAGGLAVVVWWLFFSRAPWPERLGAVALMVAAVAATPLILDQSIATGAMGMLFYLYVIPALCLAFVGWAVATRRLGRRARWAWMVAAILVACGGWALVRTGGFNGYGDSDFAWRWSATPEDRLLAEAGEVPAATPAGDERGLAGTSDEAAATGDEITTTGGEAAAAAGSAVAATATSATPAAGAGSPAAVAGDPPESPAGHPAAGEPTDTRSAAAGSSGTGPAAAAPPPAPPAPAAVPAAAPPGWPGFRGPGRDGVVRGVRIATDWTASPPVELWRRAIGPGWSSFAVRGDRLYTQEQRGDEEVVACYDAATGEPVWMHGDPARFWESNAGPGPRATPTLADGRVYALGATGILNALDAGDGAVVWSRDAAADTGAKLPGWGFAGSPLVAGDVVVAAVSGTLAGYDAASGAPRWLGAAGGEGYSSPQLVTIDGVPQVVQLSGDGAIGVAPADGTVLWEHAWKGYPIVQPGVTADGDLLLSVTDHSGLRRLAVGRGAGGWSAEERWTSSGLKPYFNDFVVHQGHAYGFDGGILASIDLADGERAWKGGRYGHGQLVLLADQDLLLVLSEKGDLALVAATPDGFTELARHPAIEGKTWNHPVLAGDLLLVRNGEEMVAFRLARAGG